MVRGNRRSDGVSQTVAVAIAYAPRDPERVTHLILYGGYALGWRRLSDAIRTREIAMNELTRVGWDQDNPAFRHMWTAQFMLDAPKEAVDAFTAMGRKDTTGEAVFRHQQVTRDVAVLARLPPPDHRPNPGPARS
jgi:hypothetical protein